MFADAPSVQHVVTTSATPPIHTDGEPSSLDAQVSACPDGSHCAVVEKAQKAIYFLRSTGHILAMPQARVSETVASLTPATAVRARVRGVDRVLDSGQLMAAATVAFPFPGR